MHTQSPCPVHYLLIKPVVEDVDLLEEFIEIPYPASREEAGQTGERAGGTSERKVVGLLTCYRRRCRAGCRPHHSRWLNMMVELRLSHRF